MGGNTFKSHNKVGETMSFQTDSSGTFDPIVVFLTSGDRVSWDWGEGSGYTAGNSVLHTYPDSTTKTVTLRTNLLRKLKEFLSPSDNIVGNLDMSGWDNLGGNFYVFDNPSLTGITHTASSQIFSIYHAYDCNLTGNHNAPFSMLGGNFSVHTNPALTNITHSASSQIFSIYHAYDCNLTGNHNVPFSRLGGNFNVHTNPALTNITHSASSQIFSDYHAYDCGLTGTTSGCPGISCLNLVMLTGLGGNFFVWNNPNLRAISFPSSAQPISCWMFSCNLTGTLDLSMLTRLNYLTIQFNNSLTNVINPTSTESINGWLGKNCNLGYINFLPLSGATISLIELQSNSMIVEEVNHILEDFDNMSTNLNPAGWTGTTLNISGTNAAPDGGTGGFNGLAALSSLTGVTNNWTITTS